MLLIGAGTIVYSNSTYSLVVGCAHQFNSGIGSVWVDSAELSRTPAKVLATDTESDLSVLRLERGGLAAIPPDPGLPKVNLRCFAVGCAGGTMAGQVTKVASVDRYLGSSNVEVFGPTRNGDSGGGWFAGGFLIGVQNSGAPEESRRIGSSPVEIRAILRKTQLVPVAMLVGQIDTHSLPDPELKEWVPARKLLRRSPTPP